MHVFALISIRLIADEKDYDAGEIFTGYDQEQVCVRYTVDGAPQAKDAGELVISS